LSVRHWDSYRYPRQGYIRLFVNDDGFAAISFFRVADTPVDLTTTKTTKTMKMIGDAYDEDDEDAEAAPESVSWFWALSFVYTF
jgi:hypothetical protein